MVTSKKEIEEYTVMNELSKRQDSLIEKIELGQILLGIVLLIALLFAIYDSSHLFTGLFSLFLIILIFRLRITKRKYKQLLKFVIGRNNHEGAIKK